MIQPPSLQLGDTIGLLCPSGTIKLGTTTTCVQTLESWGFQVIVGTTVGSKYGPFSGTDAERLAELQSMLDNPNIQAIICARGGYGLSRIIDQVHLDTLLQHPKWVVGFSDVTVLHAALQKKGIMSIHGPMAAGFDKGEEGSFYIEALQKMLGGIPELYTTKSSKENQLGQGIGQLVGGNLCLIAHLIGSENALVTKNKILLIEDIGESHYNIDRMLIQCKNAGLFDDLSGLLVGGFTDLNDKAEDFGETIPQMVQRHTQGKNYPIAFHFPIGHGVENVPVRLGASYQLEVTSEMVRLTAV